MGDANVSTDCTGESLPDDCQIGSGDPDTARIYSAFFWIIMHCSARVREMRSVK